MAKVSGGSSDWVADIVGYGIPCVFFPIGAAIIGAVEFASVVARPFRPRLAKVEDPIDAVLKAIEYNRKNPAKP